MLPARVIGHFMECGFSWDVNGMGVYWARISQLEIRSSTSSGRHQVQSPLEHPLDPVLALHEQFLLDGSLSTSLNLVLGSVVGQQSMQWLLSIPSLHWSWGLENLRKAAALQ